MLQQALHRHALQSSSAGGGGGGDETSNQATATAGGLGTVALHALTLSDDDNEEIEVRTPGASTPVSTTSTPSGSRAGSRSSSPSGQGKRRGGGAGKPRRDKSKELAKAEQNKNPLDPINRFPGEVNGRIFGELGVDELLACGLVSKRWRRSQTLSEFARQMSAGFGGVANAVRADYALAHACQITPGTCCCNRSRTCHPPNANRRILKPRDYPLGSNRKRKKIGRRGLPTFIDGMIWTNEI